MHRVKSTLAWLLGMLFVAAGVNHFVNPDFYVRIMPPYLPWHLSLVVLSGIAEVILGALLCWPRTRSAAAWGLIALLVAVFPANLHMALHPQQFPEVAPILLWMRLPLQALFMVWAFWFTRNHRELESRQLRNGA